MCQMLLSINPEHVKNILSGKKLFEFRKVRCKSDVDRIVIYATAPHKMVVAEAEIEEAKKPGISDYIIVNESLEESIDLARSIVQAEFCKRERLVEV